MIFMAVLAIDQVCMCSNSSAAKQVAPSFPAIPLVSSRLFIVKSKNTDVGSMHVFFSSDAVIKKS